MAHKWAIPCTYTFDHGMKKQSKLQNLLGKNQLPAWFKQLIFVLIVICLLGFSTAFVPELRVMPNWYYQTMIMAVPSLILIYMTLSWPGSILATAVILFPNLLYREYHHALILWCLTVPLTLVGLWLFYWTGLNPRKPKRLKQKIDHLYPLVGYTILAAVHVWAVVETNKQDSPWVLFYAFATIGLTLMAARSFHQFRNTSKVEQVAAGNGDPCGHSQPH